MLLIEGSWKVESSNYSASVLKDWSDGWRSVGGAEHWSGRERNVGGMNAFHNGMAR